MLAYGLRQGQVDAGIAGELLDLGTGLVGAQVPASQRADEIRAAPFATALQGVGIRNLVFLEMVGELVHRDVHAPVRDEPALVHRVFRRVPQGDEFVVVLEWRKVEPGRPSNQIAGDFLNGFQLLRQCCELGPCPGRDRIRPASR